MATFKIFQGISILFLQPWIVDTLFVVPSWAGVTSNPLHPAEKVLSHVGQVSLLSSFFSISYVLATCLRFVKNLSFFRTPADMHECT